MSSVSDFLGDRAPVVCDLPDAHGIAWGFHELGHNATPFPFRHPELLPQELRIRVTNLGLCRSDVFLVDGSWALPACFPMVPGHEIVGTVEKIGSAVSGFSEGDRVGFGYFRDCCGSCEFCATGQNALCIQKVGTFMPYFGGAATSFQAKAKFFYKIPNNLQGQIAPLFCAGQTVYRPLRTWGQSGMTVGIGGVGGLGHLAIQFANKMGMEVTAVSTSNDKEEDARAFGAHHYLNLKDEAAVKEHFCKFDLFIQTATSYSVKDSLNFVKPGGTLNLCGVPVQGANIDFHLPSLFYFNRTLTGNSGGSIYETDEMLEFAAQHNVLPQCEVHSFSNFQAAFNSLAKGEPHLPRYRACVETAGYFQTFTPRDDQELSKLIIKKPIKSNSLSQSAKPHHHLRRVFL